MKIKLPIALRAALLTAMSAAIYSTTVAAADFSGNITTDTTYDTAQTVATGASATVSNNATASMSSLTVQGTVNATAGKVALQTASTEATAPSLTIAEGAAVSGNFVFQKTQTSGAPVEGSGVLNLTAGAASGTPTSLADVRMNGLDAINVTGGSFKGADMIATGVATVSAGTLELANLTAKSITATGGTLNVTENATGNKMELSGGQHTMGDITLTAAPETTQSSQTYNRKHAGVDYSTGNGTVDQVTVTTSSTTLPADADGSLTVSGADTTLTAADVAATNLDLQNGTVTLDSLTLATVTTGTEKTQNVNQNVPYDASMTVLQEPTWQPDLSSSTTEEGGKLTVADGSLTVKGRVEADTIALSGGTSVLGVNGSTYADVVANTIVIGEGGAPTVTMGNVQAIESMATKGGTMTVQSVTAKNLNLGGGTLTANGPIAADTLNASAATTLNLKATGWSSTPLVSYNTMQGSASNLTTNLDVNMTAKGALGSEIAIFSGDDFDLNSLTTSAGSGYGVTQSNGKWIYSYTASGASSPTWTTTMKYENGDLVVVGTSEGNHAEEVGTDTGVTAAVEGSGSSKTLTVQGTVTNADKATIAEGGANLNSNGAIADVHAVVVTDNGVSTTENFVAMEASEIGKVTGATSVSPNQVNVNNDATIATTNTAAVNTGTLNVAEDKVLVLDGTQVNIDAIAPSDNMQRYLASKDIDPMNSTIEGSVILENNAALVSTDASRVTVLNGSISGTGVVNGITLSGESYLTAGNSPGVLTVSNVVTTPDGNNTWTAYAITNATQFGTMNADTATQLSQFKIDGNVQLNGGNRFVMALETAVPGANPGDATTYEAATDAAAAEFTRNLSQGTAFRFFDLSDGSLTGNFTSFDMAGTQEALLARGLTWDLSSLTTTGEATVRSANEGDANRVANTLVSSSKTLFAFADGARNHVYSDRVTGSNFWVGGLGDFQDLSSHNGRNGYKYNGGGYAVGMDHKTGKNAVVGLTFGQMFGEMKPKDGTYLFDSGKIDQKMTMVGLYGGTLLNVCNIKQGVHLDGYMAYGSSENKSSRSVINPILGYGGNSRANWDEDVFAVGGNASWVYQVCPALNLRPFIGIDYTAARMSSFNESGVSGLNNAYSKGRYQNLALSAGFGIDRTYTFRNGMALTPAASVAYVGDAIRQNGKVTVTNPDGSGFWERSVAPGRNAVRANAALTWKICSNWAARAGYVFEYRSGATQHGVNASLSYSF